MIIRKATVNDGLDIVEMTKRFLESSAYGRYFKFDEACVVNLIETVLGLGAIFVAEREDGRLVGMLGAVAIEHPLSGEKFAEEICWWVDPEHRSGSVGPKLLALLEGWVQMRGLDMVKIGAPADNPSVGNFYARLGYVPVETVYAKRFSDGLHDARTPGVGRGRRHGRGDGDPGSEAEGSEGRGASADERRTSGDTGGSDSGHGWGSSGF